jgi:hypothetical protein
MWLDYGSEGRLAEKWKKVSSPLRIGIHLSRAYWQAPPSRKMTSTPNLPLIPPVQAHFDRSDLALRKAGRPSSPFRRRPAIHCPFSNLPSSIDPISAIFGPGDSGVKFTRSSDPMISQIHNSRTAASTRLAKAA